MLPHAERSLRIRIVLLGALAVLAAGGLIARAWHLQVRAGGRLRAMAERQHTAHVTLKARRGLIFDRNGAELAISLPAHSVFAQPPLIENPKEAARTLARIFHGDARELAGRLGARGRGFVWLARQAEAEQIAKVRQLEMPGIGFIEESKRYYPGRELAGHLLGFVGIDSVGLEGIEFTYDHYLRGSAERVIGSRDARGRAILAGGLGSLEKLRGDSLTLTIDSQIQHIAERELSRGRKETGARAALAVVLDPTSGEILALAVEPSFDPNRFDRYTSAEFRNRAIADLYEPGSTLKAFLLAAALEEGAATANDIFFCENGAYEVYDRVFHDTRPHGWLSAANILRVSSNIGAIKIAEQLGGERYYQSLRRFGFGRRSGVDLSGEVEGQLKSPRQWSGVTLATLAFGQGIGVSGLQLASAMGAIANGGVLVKPTVLRQVRDGDGGLVHRTVPEIIDRVVSEQSAREATRILQGVVSDEGTGRAAQIPGYTVAGKTGTAQKVDPATGLYAEQLRVISFVGFAPASAPRLSILVLFDEPEGNATGGGAAAPVFARIARQALAYLEVPSDAPEPSALSWDEPREGAPRPALWEPSAVVGADSMAYGHRQGGLFKTAHLGAGAEGALPDFVGLPLREVLRWPGARGVALRWEGRGLVVRQSPEAGAPVGPGMELALVLRPPE